MKKTIIIGIGIIAAAQLFSSCKKNFLDETVYSAYAPETLADSLGLEASVVGLNNQFSNFFTYSDQQGWPSVWQAGTDIAFVPPSQKQGVEIPYYDYNQLIATDNASSYTWSWAYRLINNANIIIKNAENAVGMSQTNKNSVKSEALFFRAYAYNTLATLYGKVPLVTAPLTAPKTDFVRASVDSVNNQIIQDLVFASANLTDVGSVGSKNNANGKPAGRANKYMAMQLLAEAYIRAGKPDLAEVQCNNIINSGKFSLVNTRFGVRAAQPGDAFSDMFINGNQRRAQQNKESIWVMEMENPSTVTGGITNNPQQRRNWGAAYYQISGMTICDSLGGRGIGRMRLTSWVVYGLYENADMRNSGYNLRRKFYVNTPSSPLYGQQVPYAGDDTLFKIAPHTTKWYQYDPNDVFGFAMIKDMILMRLGETYLLLAEAQFKQGKLPEAATTVNILRARSGASPITGAQVTLNFILDERARELLAEENRRMTLMRTGTLVTRTGLYNTQTINPVLGLTTKNLLLPVPKSEIDLNKDAVLEQNPGY